MTEQQTENDHSAQRERGVMHALTCPVRRRWLRWRLQMPFWRDDKTAQMLGIAQYGCRRCGRDAIEERNRASTPEQPCQAKDFSGETWCQREVVAGRDYCWSHLPFPPEGRGDAASAPPAPSQALDGTGTPRSDS